ISGRNSGALDAAQAARERLDHRGDLRRDARGNRVHVRLDDALGHDDPVRVGAREEDELAALLAARAAVAAPARRRVRRHDTAAVDDPAELVPERRRRLAEEERMAAT